jgi:hypothetical protein
MDLVWHVFHDGPYLHVVCVICRLRISSEKAPSPTLGIWHLILLVLYNLVHLFISGIDMLFSLVDLNMLLPDSKTLLVFFCPLNGYLA